MNVSICNLSPTCHLMFPLTSLWKLWRWNLFNLCTHQPSGCGIYFGEMWKWGLMNLHISSHGSFAVLFKNRLSWANARLPSSTHTTFPVWRKYAILTQEKRWRQHLIQGFCLLASCINFKRCILFHASLVSKFYLVNYPQL